MGSLQLVDPGMVVTIPPGRGPSRSGPSCPPPDIVAAYVDGHIEESSREGLERHLADCEACLGQVGLLARAENTPVGAVPAPLFDRAAAITARGSRVPFLGWAAAAVVVLAGGMLLTQEAARPPLAHLPTSDVRGMDATEVRVLEPSDGAVLKRESGVVAWEPVSRALYYEVRFTDVDGTLWWDTRTEATVITLPADALRSGANGYIWITAHLPDNRSVRSPARAISIAAR